MGEGHFEKKKKFGAFRAKKKTGAQTRFLMAVFFFCSRLHRNWKNLFFSPSSPGGWFLGRGRIFHSD